MSNADVVTSARQDSIRNKAIVSNGQSFICQPLRPFLIYAAINQLNGKVYVGYTSQSIKLRSQNHFRAAKAGSKHTFHKAIRKYGSGAFVFYIIGHLNDHASALRAEVHDIETLKPEYNMTLGGEGAFGRRHSEETKAKMSLAAKARKGKPISPAQRAAIIQTQKKAQAVRRKRVLCENTGQSYSSLTEAASHWGLSTTQISSSCRGKMIVRRGLKFKYLDN